MWWLHVAVGLALHPGDPVVHASLADADDHSSTRVERRGKVHSSQQAKGAHSGKFFEHARLAISDRGAQAAQSVVSMMDGAVNMMDEDNRRLAVESMAATRKKQNLQAKANLETKAEKTLYDIDPEAMAVSPSAVSMQIEQSMSPKERKRAAVAKDDEPPYVASWNNYLTIFGGFGLVTLVFGARVASGLDDPVMIAKELIIYMALYMVACTAYLGTSVGSDCVWSLLQCCIADMLMGFDNLLDLSGWYSNTNIPMHKVTLLLVVGGFIQLNLRFALSIGVHFLTGQVDSLSRLAGVLVVLCGLRTLWFSSSIEKQASDEAIVQMKGRRRKDATFWDMMMRAALVESTDALGSMDSLCGKLVNTRDLLVINASSFVGVFFVRALSIVLLLNMVKKHSQEFDRFSLPTEVFLPFVGILLLLIGFHGIFPGSVPPIPPVANIAIACSIYGYLTFRLFALSRRERRQALGDVD